MVCHCPKKFPDNLDSPKNKTLFPLSGNAKTKAKNENITSSDADKRRERTNGYILLPLFSVMSWRLKLTNIKRIITQQTFISIVLLLTSKERLNGAVSVLDRNAIVTFFFSPHWTSDRVNENEKERERGTREKFYLFCLRPTEPTT